MQKYKIATMVYWSSAFLPAVDVFTCMWKVLCVSNLELYGNSVSVALLFAVHFGFTFVFFFFLKCN